MEEVTRVESSNEGPESAQAQEEEGLRERNRIQILESNHSEQVVNGHRVR